jgi:predicted DNA-binding protein with PD1-like motif
MIVARLDPGEDVLLSIKAVAEEYEVTAGMFSLIGALKSSKVGFYDPAKRTYRIVKVKPGWGDVRALEILSCMGNIAQRKGEVVVHGHIVLKGYMRNTIGGHLLEECLVYPTAELTLLKAAGVLKRVHDDAFNLALLHF